MPKLLFLRFGAFFIDYLLIVCYAALLFGLTLSVQGVLELNAKSPGPVQGQLIGFCTLTLPVFLYSYLLERSGYKGTLGKRFFKLRVSGSNPESARLGLRNFLKFLPWEIAHTGVHWLYFYTRQEQDPPLTVWLLLILPQVLVIIYVIGLFRSGGTQSVYDRIAHTYIERIPAPM